MIPDIDIWRAALLLVNLTVKTPQQGAHRRQWPDIGHKRQYAHVNGRSGLPPKADVSRRSLIGW